LLRVIWTTEVSAAALKILERRAAARSIRRATRELCRFLPMRLTQVEQFCSIVVLGDGGRADCA
jgi:hypothetical protein